MSKLEVVITTRKAKERERKNMVKKKKSLCVCHGVYVMFYLYIDHGQQIRNAYTIKNK